MKKTHCDFCQNEMLDKEGTSGVFRPNGIECLLKYRVAIAKKQDYDPSRGVRYKTVDCCINCLEDFIKDLKEHAR